MIRLHIHIASQVHLHSCIKVIEDCRIWLWVGDFVSIIVENEVQTQPYTVNIG